MKTKQKKIQSITIIGRRWFEKTNGNTYHSAQTLVNGEPGPSVSFCYGYGNQFEWNAGLALEKAGLIDLHHYRNGAMESMWSYCDRNDIAYSCQAFDVQRKKDL